MWITTLIQVWILEEINGYSCCAEGNALISDTENLEWANWEGDVQISTLDGDVLYEKRPLLYFCMTTQRTQTEFA